MSRRWFESRSAQRIEKGSARQCIIRPSATTWRDGAAHSELFRRCQHSLRISRIDPAGIDTYAWWHRFCARSSMPFNKSVWPLMKPSVTLLAGLAAAAAVSSAAAAQPGAHAQAVGGAAQASVERGRYVVRVMGCNDCHTKGYAEKGGGVPEQQWLGGDTLGYNGPWGTTYPTNLRRYFAGLTEEQWVRSGRTLTTRPPMPWFSVRAMSDDDLRAMYRYVRSLGPSDAQVVPQYQPPGQAPRGPAIRWPHPPSPKGSGSK
jgi:mono/diheme cytochrome c family protein